MVIKSNQAETEVCQCWKERVRICVFYLIDTKSVRCRQSFHIIHRFFFLTRLNKIVLNVYSFEEVYICEWNVPRIRIEWFESKAAIIKYFFSNWNGPTMTFAIFMYIWDWWCSLLVRNFSITWILSAHYRFHVALIGNIVYFFSISNQLNYQPFLLC